MEKNDEVIHFNSWYNFQYMRYGESKNITHSYYFSLNIKNGDIRTIYRLHPGNMSETKEMFRTTFRDKKNDFKLLNDCIEDGLINGEKRKGYWGTRYDKAIDRVFSIFEEYLKPSFKSEFYKNKDHRLKYNESPIYDLIVDYHLDLKGIKAHDRIYGDIMEDYPKRKWLIKNDYKFLPAVLDSYGIKSKYLIGELNSCTEVCNIKSVNFLCKLFGDNYMDYIKQSNWKAHCYVLPYNRKIHTLKNDSEKKCLVSLMSDWQKKSVRVDSLVYSLNRLLTTRVFLESKGITDLKFKTKSTHTFDYTMETWSGMKQHMSKGYRLKYDIPESFIDLIEEPIKIDNQLFIPRILQSEDDFRIEGHKMKNCMSQQFTNGILYTYVSLQCGRKTINLQYRKGELSQMYGKANTVVDESFKPAVQILTHRFEKEPIVSWKRVKFDLIKK